MTMESQIWVDADACPVVIKEVLYRAAVRCEINVTFVANQGLRVPASPFIRTYQVAKGFDVADDAIVDSVQSCDLVITNDIPLASDVLEKSAMAIDTRGQWYDPATIRARVTMRDFMETMRSSGVMTGGPAPISQQDRQQFANGLDSWLVKHRQRLTPDA